jgi:anti-sigma B factor antagonist
MKVNLHSEEKEGVVTVFIDGEFDMAASPKIRSFLAPLFHENSRSIIVDLSKVPYIDSSGIATLVEGLQWSHSKGKKFRLTQLSPTVKDVFEIARLLTVFEVFDTIEDALQGV